MDVEKVSIEAFCLGSIILAFRSIFLTPKEVYRDMNLHNFNIETGTLLTLNQHTQPPYQPSQTQIGPFNFQSTLSKV